MNALDTFRQRCADFLDEHATGITVAEAEDPRHELTHQFQQAAAAAGLAGLQYPVEYGGQDLGAEHQRIWREEASKHPLMTHTLSITQGMCLPMLNEYGTHEQRTKHQPDLISDVASLQMRAIRDGDEWIINGQKVWTTLAHVADRGIVIARTDPDQPKHRGISMFIIDMHAPGVEIRPIHQIDGGMRFNEVYLTDVRVPAEDQIGELNQGWRLATAMLMYERVAIGTGQTSGVQHARTDKLIRAATKRNNLHSPVLRQSLMKMYSAEVCQSLMGMRTRAEAQAGKTPGPGGSLGKLAGARIAAMYRDLSLTIVGPGAVAGEDNGRWGLDALTTFASGIAGGTNEIQRNIIGERVLGLPREPSVDKDLPFNQLSVGTQRD